MATIFLMVNFVLTIRSISDEVNYTIELLSSVASYLKTIIFNKYELVITVFWLLFLWCWVVGQKYISKLYYCSYREKSANI